MPLEKRQEQPVVKTQVIERKPFSDPKIAQDLAALDWAQIEKKAQVQKTWFPTTGVTYLPATEGVLTFTASNLVSSK